MKTLSIASSILFVSLAWLASCNMPSTGSCADYVTCDKTGSAGNSNHGGNESGGASSGGKSGSATGGTSSTKTTTAPCNGRCSGATPVCNADTDKCVACSENSDCTDATKSVCDTSTNVCVGCLTTSDCKDSAKPVCNTATATCVACLANTECTSAVASRCDTSTNTCTTCSADSDCSQIAGKNVCSSGTCVQCTAAKETACGTYSCNPATSACTTTVRGSVGKCLSCAADSECIGGDLATPTARCVPMAFDGAAHGNYCLQVATVLNCVAPYKVNIGATSLSGAADTYCGINQTATTCEAVVDMIASKACTTDANCGNGQGGLCKNFSLTPTPDLRCTIPCIAASECLAPPVSGSTCTSDAPYCH